MCTRNAFLRIYTKGNKKCFNKYPLFLQMIDEMDDDFEED